MSKLCEATCKVVMILSLVIIPIAVISSANRVEDISVYPIEVSKHIGQNCKTICLRIGIKSRIVAEQLYFKAKMKEMEPIQVVLDQTSYSSEKDRIIGYIKEICSEYPNVEPELIQSIVYHESRYNPKAVDKTGSCIGLMQISKRWHTDRAKKLTGSDDLFDPYVNLKTGIDYLNDLITKHGTSNIDLVIMIYNGSGDAAYSRHNSGNLTTYAKNVLNMMEALKNA